MQYAMFVCFSTFFLLIFSEVKPKVYASERLEKVGRYTEIPVTVITKLLSPVMSIVSAFIGERKEWEALSLRRDILRKLLKKDTGVETVAELIYPIHTVKADCYLSELAMKLYKSENHLSIWWEYVGSYQPFKYSRTFTNINSIKHIEE